MTRKRRSAQIGDNGGLLNGGQICAAGHSANEMWPLLAVVLRDLGQGVAFETAGNEKSASILQLLGSNVIGPRIRNQSRRDVGRCSKVSAANDKQDDDGRDDLGGVAVTICQNSSCAGWLTVAAVCDRRKFCDTSWSAVIDRRYRCAAIQRWRGFERGIHKLIPKMRRT